MKHKLCAAALLVLIAACEAPDTRPQTGAASDSDGASAAVPARQPAAVQIFGRVAAGAEEMLTAEFPARVTAVYHEPGSRVGSEAILFSLDTNQLEREQESLQTQLRRVELQIDDLSSRRAIARDPDNLERTEAVLNVQAADDERSRARAELERTQQLFREAAVSQRTLDDASERDAAAARALDRARLARQVVEDRLARTVRELGSEIELAELEYGRLRNEINDLAQRVERSGAHDGRVRSPFDNGLVTDVFVTPGDRVSTGSRLARVADGAALEIVADLPEEFLLDVSPGDRSTIVPLADRTRRYTGEVAWIASVAERSGNETTIRTRILVEDADDFLLPGMNVDVSIIPGM